MKKVFTRWIIEILAIALGIIFLVPVLFVIINSFKPVGEILTSFVSLPSKLDISNYTKVWLDMNYPRTLLNTIFVTVFGVGGTLLLSSMTAYRISRMKQKWGMKLLMFFILSMMIPFQTIMIPLMKLTAGIHFNNSVFGLTLVIIALFCPFTIFLYRNFMQSLPLELEEAAQIDGANVYQTFFKIVFPLLSPITVTAAILNVLWVWNDFILSFLMLQDNDIMTLQLKVYRYFGKYNLEWNLSLASLVLAALPVIVFYICLQKYIIKGVTAGSVKG